MIDVWLGVTCVCLGVAHQVAVALTFDVQECGSKTVAIWVETLQGMRD